MTYVCTNVTTKQLDALQSKGYNVLATKSSYEQLRLGNGAITFILYTSGKLVIQHKSEDAQEVEVLLRRLGLAATESQPKTKPTSTAAVISLPTTHIGSDEALKGDTFGGLVVAGFLMKEGDATTLRELGVQDSKNLTDEKIQRLAQVIAINFAGQCYIEDVDSREYNATIAQTSLTSLLNEMHGTVGIRLRDDNKDIQHVVDMYPGCNVGDIRLEKAESHSLAVAAASILARAKGLEQIRELSAAAGFTIPLGSTHVRDALKRLVAEKKDVGNFAKVHFKNVQEFL